MVSTPVNEEQTTEQNTQEQNIEKSTSENVNTEDNSFVNRVINYPTVSNLWETAKGYYSTAKDSSTLVKKGCETLESNLDTTMKYIQPVIENETVKKYTHTVDNFGCKQLDKLEKLGETYQPTIESLKEKGSSIVESSVQKIEPIDQYLKNSYIGAPINMAVSVTEKLCDKFLPEETKSTETATETQSESETSTKSESESQESEKSEDGPIFRGSKVAMRLQKETMSKLSNLNLRDISTQNSYVHVVDLIQYAAKNLDIGVNASSKLLNDSYKSISENVGSKKENIKHMIADAPKKIQENQTVAHTQEQLQHYTKDAIDSIYHAIELLSKQIPGTVYSSFDKTKTFAVKIEETNMNLYNAIASKSAEKLRQASDMINVALQSSARGELSAQVIEQVKSSLVSVLDSVQSVRNLPVVDNFINKNLSPVQPTKVI